MPQARTGKTKSMPKVVRVNADDGDAILYRNLGNGRRLTFAMGLNATLASGVTSVVIASGINYGGYKLCDGIFSATLSEAVVVVSGTIASGTPNTELVGKYYIQRNTTENVVTLRSTATPTATTNFDIIVMLGTAASI